MTEHDRGIKRTKNNIIIFKNVFKVTAAIF